MHNVDVIGIACASFSPSCGELSSSSYAIAVEAMKVMTKIIGGLVILMLLTCIGLAMAMFAKERENVPVTTLTEEPDVSEEFLNEPIRPIPLRVRLDKRKVELGNKLFHDSLLSQDGKISCATCHSLAMGGVDRKTQSIGINDTAGGINAPTVLNASLNFVQFWDGRAPTLEEQISGPVTNPKEMGSNWDEVLSKLSRSPDYKTQFSKIYEDGITEHNIKDSIATFERSLYTPNSRFDQYLRGNRSAITQEEKEGYAAFKQLGCTTCHQGMGVGGNMFQPFGVMGNYFADRGNITKADYGRYNVTQQEADRYKFKVPSLRNVDLTAPYFHDGSATTLDEAVRVMAKYQLGIQLDERKAGSIVKFLKTLTGEMRSGE